MLKRERLPLVGSGRSDGVPDVRSLGPPLLTKRRNVSYIIYNRHWEA